MTTDTLHFIDPDCARRAAIASGLRGAGFHAEPYESVAELAAMWPTAGVVLFHDGPGLHAELCTAMARAGVWLPVIAYGENAGSERIVRLMLSGVAGFLDLPFALAALPQLIDEMVEGTRGRMIHARRGIEANARLARLSAREGEVLGALARGQSNKAIARELEISPRTVEIHRAHMMDKLGVGSLAEAVRIMLEAEMAVQLKAA